MSTCNLFYDKKAYVLNLESLEGLEQALDVLEPRLSGARLERFSLLRRDSAAEEEKEADALGILREYQKAIFGACSQAFIKDIRKRRTARSGLKEDICSVEGRLFFQIEEFLAFWKLRENSEAAESSKWKLKESAEALACAQRIRKTVEITRKMSSPLTPEEEKLHIQQRWATFVEPECAPGKNLFHSIFPLDALVLFRDQLQQAREAVTTLQEECQGSGKVDKGLQLRAKKHLSNLKDLCRYMVSLYDEKMNKELLQQSEVEGEETFFRRPLSLSSRMEEIFENTRDPKNSVFGENDAEIFRAVFGAVRGWNEQEFGTVLSELNRAFYIVHPIFEDKKAVLDSEVLRKLKVNIIPSVQQTLHTLHMAQKLSSEDYALEPSSTELPNLEDTLAQVFKESNQPKFSALTDALEEALKQPEEKRSQALNEVLKLAFQQAHSPRQAVLKKSLREQVIDPPRNPKELDLKIAQKYIFQRGLLPKIAKMELFFDERLAEAIEERSSRFSFEVQEGSYSFLKRAGNSYQEADKKEIAQAFFQEPHDRLICLFLEACEIGKGKDYAGMKAKLEETSQVLSTLDFPTFTAPHFAMPQKMNLPISVIFHAQEREIG